MKNLFVFAAMSMALACANQNTEKVAEKSAEKSKKTTSAKSIKVENFARNAEDAFCSSLDACKNEEMKVEATQLILYMMLPAFFEEGIDERAKEI